jgi:hypothetical protein
MLMAWTLGVLSDREDDAASLRFGSALRCGAEYRGPAGRQDAQPAVSGLDGVEEDARYA